MTAPDLLEKLAIYVPDPVAQATFRRPQPITGPAFRRLSAAVLYANISGFTPLSELLNQAGTTGIQELNGLANQYFTQIIELVQAYHGQVVKFSSDALTAIFSAEDISMQLAIRRAGECTLTLQSKMNRFSTIETAYGQVSLSMKVGLGAGEILEGTIGGALGRWEYVVGGDPIIQAAMAKHQAKPGQVVISPQAWKEVQRFFIGIPNINRRGFVNLFKLNQPALETITPAKPNWGRLTPEEQTLAHKVLHGYLPGAINASLDTQFEGMAELRQMTILAVGVGGLDYGAKGIAEQLQNLLRATQEVAYLFEGSLGKVTVDDKGTVISILFGAPPLPHEDDTARAVACAIRLQAVAREQNLQMAIGITEGAIFTGLIGAPHQQEYTVIGSEVDLATRLMQYGHGGTIILSERVKNRAGSRFIIEDLGEITLKGNILKAHLVKGEHGVPDEFANRYLLRKDLLVGRKAELEQIRRMSARAQAGKLQPLFIEGELGIGKSRLAAAMAYEWTQAGGVTYSSKSLSYAQQMPYQSWREVLVTIFGLTSSLSPQQQLEQLAVGLVNLPPPFDQPNYWTNRLPLLADILGFEAPENEFTRHISRELRRNNTFATFEATLRHQAMQHPLLILLEDIHWADELSLALAAYLVRALDSSPILLTMVHRPIAKEYLYALAEIKNLPYTHTIQLNRLSQQESFDLVRILAGNTLLSPEIENILLTRGRGNPFFLQEITRSVTDVSGDKEKQDFDLLKTLDLPNTVQDVILARIERLTEAEKLTLKIASVIGSSFKRSLLAEVHPVTNAQLILSSQLNTLENEDLLRLEAPAPSWEYSFHNVVAQEVVYEGLLPIQRQQLHAVVGRALEALAPDEVEQLAFHYRQSDNWDKALQYLKAASQKAHREYANQAAIDYYTEILIHLADTEKGPGTISAEYWGILLERAKLYNLTGQLEEDSEDLGTLGIIAEALDDNHRRALAAQQWGHFYETMGDYPSGLEQVERSLRLAQQTADEKLCGETYNQAGKLLYLLGQYKSAHSYLEQALAIAQAHQDDNAQAECFNNLGFAAHYQANYSVALGLFQDAIDAWQKIGNLVGLGNGLSNLGRVYYDMGQYLVAQQCYNQALDLHRKIGDRAGEALTQHNLGKIYRSLGNYEQAHLLLEEAFTFYLSAGDRQREAHSLYHLGFLYCRQGKDKIALHFMKESIAILKDLNDPWALSRALTYYGWILYSQEQFEDAKEKFTTSLKIGRTTQRGVAMMENMALLGSTALALNDEVTAEACAKNALSFIERQGTQGIEHPAMVYLACYDIFQAIKKPKQAGSALTQGYQFVITQADQIDDLTLREHYLKNIPENRELQDLQKL